MSAVLSIWRRELQAYFVSPIAYTVIVIVLGIAGFAFLYGVNAYSGVPAWLLEENGLNIRNFIIRHLSLWINVGMIFALPALSMRVFTEERTAGTAELLMTSPITTAQLVVGKYLGTLTVLAVTLLLTTPYIGFLMFKGQPELAAVGSAYLGYFLYGGVILAIGLFASARTENQIVALLSTYAIFLPLWLLELVVGFSGKTLDDIFAAIAVGRGIRWFARGVIDTHFLVLDGALIFLFLFLCAQVIDSSRWR